MGAYRVSVITPSYNQAQFLEETILSVLNQTYQNIEYIIIDGESTDQSIEIIKKYEDRIAYWVSEKDNGQADAINKGFKKATGDYLCWVNSDDLLYPDFIARRLAEFTKSPSVGLIYGDVDQGWDLKSKVLRKGEQQTYEGMLNTCFVKVPQMSAVWSRSAFEKTGLLEVNLGVLLDWEYILRTAKNVNILYSPGSVAFFRQHKNSKSVKHNTLWANETETYYLDLFSKGKFEKKFMQLSLLNMYFYCANIFKEDNDPVTERKYLLKAENINRHLYFLKRNSNRVISLLVKTKKILYGRK